VSGRQRPAAWKVWADAVDLAAWIELGKQTIAFLVLAGCGFAVGWAVIMGLAGR
jgi:hypothetical protein